MDFPALESCLLLFKRPQRKTTTWIRAAQFKEERRQDENSGSLRK